MYNSVKNMLPVWSWHRLFFRHLISLPFAQQSHPRTKSSSSADCSLGFLTISSPFSTVWAFSVSKFASVVAGSSACSVDRPQMSLWKRVLKIRSTTFRAEIVSVSIVEINLKCRIWYHECCRVRRDVDGNSRFKRVHVIKAWCKNDRGERGGGRKLRVRIPLRRYQSKNGSIIVRNDCDRT